MNEDAERNPLVLLAMLRYFEATGNFIRYEWAEAYFELERQKCDEQSQED